MNFLLGFPLRAKRSFGTETPPGILTQWGFCPIAMAESFMANDREREYLRLATHAREEALRADFAQKPQWLKIAQSWETLAREYNAFQEMQSALAPADLIS
jgi:hypothetical protein